MTVGSNLTADAVEGDNVTLSAKVYDEQGVPINAIVSFTRTANDNEWTYEISNEDGAWTTMSGTTWRRGSWPVSTPRTASGSRRTATIAAAAT